MTLDEITSSLMDDLEKVVGSSEWWTEAGLAIHELSVQVLAEKLKNVTTTDVTVSSTIDLARYVVPKATGVGTVLKLLKVTIDSEPIDGFTVDELYGIDYKWRTLGSGTPWGWYFERGDLNLAVSFIPKFAKVMVLGFEYVYKPIDLTGALSPKEPYTDGDAIKDGVMSLALSEAGGGRDLDLSEYYYGRLIARFGEFEKHSVSSPRGLKSPEERIATAGRVRLPSNYPTYFFNE